MDPAITPYFALSLSIFGKDLDSTINIWDLDSPYNNSMLLETKSFV
jgi:hypothetical protein